MNPKLHCKQFMQQVKMWFHMNCGGVRPEDGRRPGTGIYEWLCEGSTAGKRWKHKKWDSQGGRNQEKMQTFPLNTALIVFCNKKQNFSSVENLFIYSFYVLFCSWLLLLTRSTVLCQPCFADSVISSLSQISLNSFFFLLFYLLTKCQYNTVKVIKVPCPE